MKKYKLLSTLLIIGIFSCFIITQVNASSGYLKKDSIIMCPDGKYYGYHGADNHWHEAEQTSGSSGWKAVGDIISGPDPCNRYSTLPFYDVKTYDWYYESVKYAYEGSLILGYNYRKFAPNDKVTRGQLVTIIWRYEDNPIIPGSNKFLDVRENDYYTEAIKWASNNDIIHGYNDSQFGPNDPITRQDLIVIMNNYAKYKGIEWNTYDDLSFFVDKHLVLGNYSEVAIKWAVANKIISGKDINGYKFISPAANTTRAETAAIVINFLFAYGLYKAI